MQTVDGNEAAGRERLTGDGFCGTTHAGNGRCGGICLQRPTDGLRALEFREKLLGIHSDHHLSARIDRLPRSAPVPIVQ